MNAIIIFRKLRKPFIIFKIAAFLLIDVELTYAPPINQTKFQYRLENYSSLSKIHESHNKLIEFNLRVTIKHNI